MKKFADIENKRLKKALKKRNYRTVAFDLDGTLAHSSEWKSYTYIGKPNVNVVNFLKKEKKRGSKIIIHSCRVSTIDNIIHPIAVNTIIRWLRKHKIPADGIWLGTGKAFANLYVDDSAMNPNCSECVSRHFQ